MYAQCASVSVCVCGCVFVQAVLATLADACDLLVPNLWTCTCIHNLGSAILREMECLSEGRREGGRTNPMHAEDEDRPHNTNHTIIFCNGDFRSNFLESALPKGNEVCGGAVNRDKTTTLVARSVM